MPATEDLLIIIDGKTATDNIPFRDLRIVNERGNRVSTCSFTLENGVNFGLARWRTIVIYSTDLETVHFNGFIMDFGSTKNGIRIDYRVNCSSVEILLQRAIIDDTLTGTDGDILADILANGYPNLSDMFDWTSLLTAALSNEIDMSFQDSTLLDALEALSQRAGGVEYSQGYNASMRINLSHSPGVTNAAQRLAYYDGRHPTGSDWATTYSGWTGTTSFDDAFGETGGGIRQIAQSVSGKRTFLHFPQAVGTLYIPKIRINRTDETWLGIRFRGYIDGAAGTYTVTFSIVTYNNDLTIYHDGSSILLTDTGTSVGAWDIFQRSIDLSDEATIPANGWIVIQIMTHHATNAFTLYYDNFLVELLNGVSEPTPGSYFDGDTTGFNWMGAAYTSPSGTAANPLRWGSNRDAPFDVDIGNMDEIIDDFNINFNGFDGINAIIVIGSYEWEDVDWIYPNNGNTVSVHFDLELAVHPADTFSQPIIYTNIGSDGTPNWSTKTVATRQAGFAAGDVLYDLEDHWVEFQDPPPDLELSWRIVGRIKKTIRVIVQDEDSVEEAGIELVDTLFSEQTTGTEAFDIGQAELAKRIPTTTVNFTTYEPGLLAGDEIDIVDSLQDFSETLIIERVTRTYLGGGKGKFRVECGRYNTDLSDIIKGIGDTADPKVPADEDVTTVTIGYLVDQDSKVLLDQDSRQILDIVG